MSQEEVISEALRVFGGKPVKVAHHMTPTFAWIIDAARQKKPWLAAALERAELISEFGKNPITLLLRVKSSHELDYFSDPVTRAGLEGIAMKAHATINLRFTLCA